MPFRSLLVCLLSCLFAASAAGSGLPARFNPEDPPPDPLTGIPVLADTVDIQRQVSDTLMTLRLSGHDLVVPYYSNGRLLAQPYPEVSRAVVVVHGTLRNADNYLRSIRESASGVPGADSTSFCIAPQFLTEADVQADTLSSAHLFWAYMGWRQGDRSLNTTAHPRPAVISSYAVLDSVLLRLAQVQPNLAQVVVAGHSAGGQFLNRYAAGTQMPQILAAYGITIRFIVSNPSSYLYFDNRRWVAGTDNNFAVPALPEMIACPGYNLYKYGLESPNEYMNLGSSVLRTQYYSRDVEYLLGGEDCDPNSAYLERNCEAMMQGEYRMQRGLLYRLHLISTFGSSILSRHHFAVIPNVGHDNGGIFSSSCGRYYLFDYGSCNPSLPNPPWQDRTTVALRAVTGRSVSWGDFNGDGRPDLYVSASNDSDRLFRNDGTYGFVEATPAAMADTLAGMSACWGDVDNDGRPDLYATNWRGQNRLFWNEGNGDFKDIASGPLAAGGDLSESDWADYDRDGDLDVVLVRSGGVRCDLLRNDGQAGFTDVTFSPLGDSVSTRDVNWVDYDGDHDPDLFLARSDWFNRLLRNDGNGTFTDVTPSALNDDRGSWAGAWGDYDNDEDMDLFLGKRGGACKLLRNDGAAGFTDVSAEPININTNMRSACWGDCENDGDLDLYISMTSGKNRLFRNDGGAAFTDITVYPLNDMGNTWGAAWADYDGDGLLDLAIADDGNWNKLFRNKGLTPPNHWLEVELRGVQSNRLGVGARVRVSAGGRRQIRDVGLDGGALSQNSSTVHFGLGSSTTVDTLQVFWPSGIVQTEVFGFPADRKITVYESSLPAGVEAQPIGPEAWRGPFPNPFAEATSVVLPAGSAWTADGPLVSGSGARVRIFDASGRLLRTLRSGVAVNGGVSFTWDGKDELGREAASGIYFLRASTGRSGEKTMERAVVKVR